MRRRFIHQEEVGENFCKIILTTKTASFSVPLYGEQFDSSQFSYIKIDNKQHDINLREILLAIGEHTIEYGFNVLINGDDFLSGGNLSEIDVIEFNVDTSKTVSMARMFVGINSIINLDHINISNVKSMEYMFMNSLIVESPFTRLHDTLYENCYHSMYLGCSNLTTAPELPATTLTKSCYSSMFSWCTSLTSAPELPATTLVDSCYDSMFYNCSKLNYIKMLATDISASYCLQYWVHSVSPTGTFVKNPEATWEVYGDNGIPDGWKVVMDGEESNLKSFQVDNMGDVEEFYFEDGMTWGEWVDSEYNNGDYTVDEFDGSICKLESGFPIGWIGNDYDYVLSSDIILEATYYLIY